MGQENEYVNGKGSFKEGNPGRPKGTRNKRSQYWEEMGDWFANEGLDAYTENLETMLTGNNRQEKAEGMKRFEALLEYFKPKLQRTESNINVEGTVPIMVNKNYNEKK